MDDIFARLKSNGKFSCESDQGYIQKARRLDTMHDRSLVLKYFMGNQNERVAAMQQAGHVFVLRRATWLISTWVQRMETDPPPTPVRAPPCVSPPVCVAACVSPTPVRAPPHLCI